jgi:DNA-binding response OmpR family regulator
MRRTLPFGGIAQGHRAPQTERSLSSACLHRMSPPSTSGVIVIVEDPFIRRFVRSILGRLGHYVMESDEADALKLAANGLGSVKLLITNKPDVFERLDRTVPILYLSATPDWDLAARFRNLRVLQKPFHAHELLEAVVAATEQNVPS